MFRQAKEIHDHYFKPKPVFQFRLYDSAIEEPLEPPHPDALAEQQSIDIYVNVVV